MKRENFVKALVEELKAHKFAVVPDVFKKDFMDATEREGLFPTDEVYLTAGSYPEYPLGGTGFLLE